MPMNPNEPRRMTPPRGRGALPSQHVEPSGSAARDGFTRIARRIPPGQQGGDGIFTMTPSGAGGYDQPVGERDYNRGPRFSED